MKKRFFQSACLQFIYKGFVQYFLKLIVGIHFSDNSCLKSESQFIILANHNSHLDTLALMASLPRKILWKVKPVAAEDYFGNTKIKASLSNYFINTLLIRRKADKDASNDPIKKIIAALDEGYSLIFFPEGTRGTAEQMDKIKPGISRILSERPHIKYLPVFMTGMGRSLPKGDPLLLPYKSSVNYGALTSVLSRDAQQIMQQITLDFDEMKARFQPAISSSED